MRGKSGICGVDARAVDPGIAFKAHAELFLGIEGLSKEGECEKQRNGIKSKCVAHKGVGSQFAQKRRFGVWNCLEMKKRALKESI